MRLLKGMVGKRVGVALVALCVGQVSFAQVLALYTNAPSGAVVMLSSNASVTNTSSKLSAGIVFGSEGKGNGEVKGPGNLEIYVDGADAYGIYASSVTLSQYDGQIAVNSGGSAKGINGNVYGNISGTVLATATRKVSVSTSSYAGAGAEGINGDVLGNISGIVSAEATGGSIASSNAQSSASSGAVGIDGDVAGKITGLVCATATGGSAVSPENLNDAWADADATSFGINGRVGGDLLGTVSSTAMGGLAESPNSSADTHAEAFGAFLYTFSHDFLGDVSATAKGGESVSGARESYRAKSSAKAYAIVGSVLGNISGVVSAVAHGGTAINPDSYADASAFASATLGDVSGNMTGIFSANAIGGTASGRFADASATAYGVYGSWGDVSGDITGCISAHAIGGLQADTSGSLCEVKAYGIYGETVVISNLTGSVKALTESSSTNDQYAGYSHRAVGIEASDRLYLNVDGGTISAQQVVLTTWSSPNLYTNAHIAVQGGTNDDVVILKHANIIGDIDLRSGANQLLIMDDSRTQGDLVDCGLFSIQSGLLTPVGRVHASGLLNNQMHIGSSGGFAFELYENPAAWQNSTLMVDGQISATNGASIAAYAAAGQTAQKIVGNSYEVVTATDGIDGTFVENTKSLFDLDIVVGETNIVITPTGIKGQVGENTPTGNGVTQASIASANRAINNLSQHAGAIRSMLRNGSAPQTGNAPQGAAGPSLAQQELTSGEWATFVRQFNDMGSQDSEGGIAGYDWNCSGFLVGFEKLVGDGLVVGTSGGGAWTDLDGLDGSGGGASEMFVGSVFMNAFSETWYSEAGLSYAHAWNDAERIASDTQRYMGEYESDLFGGWLELGYTLAGEKYSVEPYGRGTYLNGQHDGYSDEGGTNPLTVDSSTSDNLLTELGIRTIRDWRLANETRLRTAVKAGWQCELMDDTITANGTLLGASQRLTSPEADRNALVLGINADWQLTDKVFLLLDYEPTLSGNWFNHSVNGEIKVVF